MKSGQPDGKTVSQPPCQWRVNIWTVELTDFLPAPDMTAANMAEFCHSPSSPALSAFSWPAVARGPGSTGPASPP